MNDRKQWLIVGGIVALVAVVITVATYAFGDSMQAIDAGTKAPEFKAVTVAAGEPVRTKTLADYKGQVVLLNMWATWCNPCRAEMPSMQKLQESLGPKGLKIVAVSVDNAGMEQQIRDFSKQFGLTFEILYDQTGDIETAYQTTGIPETFVIGRDGVIRKRVLAASDWAAEPQQALIRQLLAEPAP
ncbi:MAG: TlpA family protein disulfide reductase [Gemmatimonadetes bacterium]|nr:TlpA family protein disulfide reductase [Gemmatimonadota bacterium]MBI3567741.1 TlpA family protein disulfide reductase [Gemmatimonadota bacterium]